MKLKAIKRIRAILLAKTGLRIGMSRDQMAIGDLDNPVIRNPLTDEPYIPGSSLKGKLRYLLEWSLGGDYILKAKDKHVFASEDPKDPVARIFGLAPENEGKALEVARERGPTRLLVRDAYLTPDSKEELERTVARGGYLTEIKQEVFIPRLGGNANPRTTERVPAGSRFAVEMTYRILDDPDEEYFQKYLLRALRLLELDGLGGHISRGYGQVFFLHPEKPPEAQEGLPLEERLLVETQTL
ncbi:type III-A CRISPR-associated RAMP protein Csm3 [Thermus scotoductus]|uniref:CRISPR system Cms endoribonuclease Csm3 n=1 Tax=Thermus scotoductus TaxID=37636 RepID=A0A430QYN3_THESC|nr:type III-A CRISPR-associated RAMP protein Csm3 [Thermus scotoductus]RTG97549.1 type III-A CRISPR-associated RAMP protein Csm3 [Thermus scotoductus]RTH00234.1 type III-A CRISPR-associated RAMP protein Csm3 [Thermus scotoductus]RTH22442.1 type III-A CRISPR-associated RAMP protein Csm3 [Thermus scotoductus]RTI02038.1 type III-A CRISPR-associated RAMP protein Csm3 [Thermus scotoductus]RTI24367.1 type III-A CRISPR-associated RAMP protein Csm3 [Thermus scotoductus]